MNDTRHCAYTGEPCDGLDGCLGRCAYFQGPPQACYDYPLRPDFRAQVVLPRDFTMHDANRICAFIMTLAQPSPQNGSHED